MFLFHSILISNTTFLPFPLIWRWPFSRTLCHIISHLSHSTYHLFNTLLLLSICLLTYQEIKILSGQEMCPFCSPQCFRLESGIWRTQYIFIEWTNDNCKIKWLGNHVLLRGDFKLLDDPWEEKPIVIDKTLRKHCFVLSEEPKEPCGARALSKVPTSPGPALISSTLACICFLFQGMWEWQPVLTLHHSFSKDLASQCAKCLQRPSYLHDLLLFFLWGWSHRRRIQCSVNCQDVYTDEYGAKSKPSYADYKSPSIQPEGVWGRAKKKQSLNWKDIGAVGRGMGNIAEPRTDVGLLPAPCCSTETTSRFYCWHYSWWECWWPPELWLRGAGNHCPLHRFSLDPLLWFGSF